MTEKLKEVIKRELGKLPKENQEAISSLNWGNISEEIGKKYLLNESELNDFQVQTLLVLIGIEDPDDYPQNIENEVGISKKEAEKIAEEVTQKIFIPINDILIENIKKSEKIRNTDAEQNLNFILSGGDYSVFLEASPLLDKEGAGDGNSEDNHLAFGTPPQQGGEGNETVVPVFSITEENLKKSSV